MADEPLDLENPEHIVRLALSSIFMTTMIARGGIPKSADEMAIFATVCADALLRANAIGAAEQVPPT